MQATYRTWATLTWVALGAVLTLILLEMLLRALPVAGEGVYAADFDPQWPMHHLVPNSRFTYSAGWNLDLVHEGPVNNMGYVAPFDYRDGASAIAVLGDSYIESLMNGYDETLQGRLRQHLRADIPVLQFGSSGASMADYLGVARLVSQRFNPVWGVVLLSEGDFREGFSPARGYHAWDATRDPPVKITQAESERSALVKWARQLALVRYLRYNLKFRPSQLIHLQPVMTHEEAKPECRPASLSEDDQALVSRFANELPAAFGLPAERVILIFDSDRKSMYGPAAGPKPRCPDRDDQAQALLRNRAAAQGMHIIETEPLFLAYHRRTGRRVDHSPVDWHWNGEAHRLVAEQVAAIIASATPDT
jgi:hypothetical protein